MKKQFYSHLLEIDFLHEEIDTLELSSEEKDELKNHVHSSIHYTVLDIVLSALPEEHKKKFIEHVNSENHTATWEHIKMHTENIENKIKEKTVSLAKEFLEDLHKAR